MSDAESKPLWKRWWVWCVVSIAFVGVLANEGKRFYDRQIAADKNPIGVITSVGESFNAGYAKPGDDSPEIAKAPTTGDTQIDALLRDEMRRWQDDFGFDESVLVQCVERSIHAFRPFLLFRAGREAVQEVCRDAHDDAERSRRRLNRGGQFGRAGREDTLQRGTYVVNAIEAAAGDWLQDKTQENIDPEVPVGGRAHRTAATLHVGHGNLIDFNGRLIWPGRPDLPTAVNARIAAAMTEWVDEFQLCEEDVAPLARAVLSRLLLLQPGPTGAAPIESVRVRACDDGLRFLRQARDEARPLYQRIGWVNVPHVARLAAESAAHEFEAARDSQIVQASESENAASKSSAVTNAGLAMVATEISSDVHDRPGSLCAPFSAAAAQSARAWWASGLELPVQLTNSVGAKLMLIPAGEFYMGSTPMEIGRVRRIDPTFKKEWEQEEQPQHHVRITRPYFMSAQEVTRGEFAQFVRASGYRTDSQRDGKGGCGFDAATGEFKQDPVYDWQNTGFPQTDRDPVVNVSWNDAVAYCEWMTRREKAVYRLPTEAEWEYCCRAGTTTLFYCGDDPEALSTVANVADATLKQKFHSWTAIAARDGFAFTAPVGSLQANGFGLFDMHGNVWEWCQDWYAKGYYAKSAENDPQGPVRGSVRVFRGGSWYDSAALSRSAFRNWDVPSYRDYFLGFRVVAIPPGR